MKKIFKVLITMVSIVLLSCNCFAADLTTPVDEVVIEPVVTVDSYNVSLSLSNSNAICTVKVEPSVAQISKIVVAEQLLNKGGDVKDSYNKTITAISTRVSFCHVFKLSAHSTYHIKYSIKTYKSGKLKDSISGTSSSVKY